MCSPREFLYSYIAAYMLQKIAAQDLKIGMYVADLDRPWIDTPFLRQGFLLEDEEQLQQLRLHCQWVMFDPQRSAGHVKGVRTLWADLRGGIAGMFARHAPEKLSVDNQPESAAPATEVFRPAFVPASLPLTTYENKTTFEVEIGAAAASFKRTNELLNSIAEDVRVGHALPFEKVKSAIGDMVDSMVRNPDALIWVARMREQDLNIYSHGISVAVNLIAFGRHLGYPNEQLAQLGMLGLLLDIGKLKLSRELLEKNQRLSADEFEEIKDHVDLGLAILRETPGIHPDICDGIAQHHERMNGSGYPNNLMGDEISIFGRMSAIADTYAAVTKPRPYAELVSPHQAVQMLSNWSGSQFQADMVEQFIESIGVFPVGSMVELSSGEVAVVVTHCNVAQSRPKVLVLTEADKTIRANPAERDLLLDAATPAVHILRGLPSKAYGLVPPEFYAA